MTLHNNSDKVLKYKDGRKREFIFHNIAWKSTVKQIAYQACEKQNQTRCQEERNRQLARSSITIIHCGSSAIWQSDLKELSGHDTHSGITLPLTLSVCSFLRSDQIELLQTMFYQMSTEYFNLMLLTKPLLERMQ